VEGLPPSKNTCSVSKETCNSKGLRFIGPEIHYAELGINSCTVIWHSKQNIKQLVLSLWLYHQLFVEGDTRQRLAYITHTLKPTTCNIGITVAHLYADTQRNSHTCMHTHVYIHTNTHTHIYTQTHKHTHT